MRSKVSLLITTIACRYRLPRRRDAGPMFVNKSVGRFISQLLNHRLAKFRLQQQLSKLPSDYPPSPSLTLSLSTASRARQFGATRTLATVKCACLCTKVVREVPLPSNINDAWTAVQQPWLPGIIKLQRHDNPSLCSPSHPPRPPPPSSQTALRIIIKTTNSLTVPFSR